MVHQQGNLLAPVSSEGYLLILLLEVECLEEVQPTKTQAGCLIFKGNQETLPRVHLPAMARSLVATMLVQSLEVKNPLVLGSLLPRHLVLWGLILLREFPQLYLTINKYQV